MNKLLLIIILLASNWQSRAQLLVSDSILADGVYRQYIVYLPANYTAGPPRPLILNMHGLGSTNIEQYFYSNFKPIADTAGFLMVYPQGLISQGTTYWNVGITGLNLADDVAFLSQLIDTLSIDYSIDADRVYATGMSMGGYMSHFLGCRLSGRVAAIASVTGTMTPDVYAGCNPGRTVPAMQIHGTADSVVPYSGNANGIHIDTLVKFWVRNNHLNPAPVITQVPNINSNDNSTAERRVYSSNSNSATVEFYKVFGGEHTWPGAPLSIGVTNQDFNASVEIWRFFSKYRRSAFTAVERSKGTGSIHMYPNPCKDRVYIQSPIEGTTTIKDMSGRILATTTENNIDMKNMPAGIYLMQYESSDGRTLLKLLKQ